MWRLVDSRELLRCCLVFVALIICCTQLVRSSAALAQYPCHAEDTGRPLPCAPSDSILLSALTGTVASADSTCGKEDGGAGSKICYIRQGPKPSSASDLYRCVECNQQQEHPPGQAIDNRPLNTWWQSEVLSPTKQSVVFRLDFPGKFLLTSLHIRFGVSQPTALRIQVSGDSPDVARANWTLLRYYADDCLGRYWNASPGKCFQFNSSGLNLDVQLPELQTLLGDKQQLVSMPTAAPQFFVQRLRIVFDKPAEITEHLDELRGVLPQADLPNFEHYSIADIKAYGLCYCNGHAERCDPVTGALLLFAGMSQAIPCSLFWLALMEHDWNLLCFAFQLLSYTCCVNSVNIQWAPCY